MGPKILTQQRLPSRRKPSFVFVAQHVQEIISNICVTDMELMGRYYEGVGINSIAADLYEQAAFKYGDAQNVEKDRVF